MLCDSLPCNWVTCASILVIQAFWLWSWFSTTCHCLFCVSSCTWMFCSCRHMLAVHGGTQLFAPLFALLLMSWLGIHFVLLDWLVGNGFIWALVSKCVKFCKFCVLISWPYNISLDLPNKSVVQTLGNGFVERVLWVGTRLVNWYLFYSFVSSFLLPPPPPLSTSLFKRSDFITLKASTSSRSNCMISFLTVSPSNSGEI